MQRTIDVNADLGEGGAFDEQLFPLISSANIACGVHAGDWTAMANAVRSAIEHGVAIGAHPSSPDRTKFGRVTSGCVGYSGMDIRNALVYQLGALAAFCKLAAVPMTHIKAHGSLYNTAMTEPPVARIIASFVRDFDPSLTIFAQPGSVLEEIARDQELTVRAEAFADRAYHPDGTLVSRDIPGAVLHDPELIADRMERLLTEGAIETIDGQTIPLQAETVCIHSDTAGAVEIALALRNRFASLGIAVRANP